MLKSAGIAEVEVVGVCTSICVMDTVGGLANQDYKVTAPIIEAQLLETFLLNTFGFQTMIASKAARCFHAAAGRPLIDFSLRRTQGRDAGLKAARSMFIAGFEATSNVLAGKKQVFRKSGQNGRYLEDVIALREETVDQGQALLEKVMANGELLRPHPLLQALQNRFKKNFAALDNSYKSFTEYKACHVTLSKRLRELQQGD